MGAFLLKDRALRLEPQSQARPKLQIEQVEHALDDMDMLTQLSMESASDQAHPLKKTWAEKI